MPNIISKRILEQLLIAIAFCFSPILAFANQPPQLEPIPAQTVSAGQQVSVWVKPTDPDGTVPGLLVVSPPEGSQFVDNNDGSRTFRWTPSSNDVGSRRIEFVAKDALDDGLRVSQFLVVNVQGVVGGTSSTGAGPQLARLNDVFTSPGQTILFRVGPADSNGPPTTIDINWLPGASRFGGNGDGSETFIWRPGFEDIGTYEVRFSIYERSNPSLRSSSTIRIYVGTNESTPPIIGPADPAPTPSPTPAPSPAPTPAPNPDGSNSPPILSIPSPQSLRAGSTFTQRVRPVDPDGQVPGLILLNPPNGSEFVDDGNGGRIFRWTPASFQSGVFRLRFVATDAMDSSIVTQQILVLNVAGFSTTPSTPPTNIPIPPVSTAGNLAPVIRTIGEQRTRVGQRLEFVVVADDPEGIVPGLLTRNAPNSSEFVDNGNGGRIFRWTPTASDVGILGVDFIARDQIDPTLESVERVRITVEGDAPVQPQPPVNPTTNPTVPPPIPPTNPGNGDILASDTPSTRSEAGRFLMRATFGPNEADVNGLMRTTYQDWIDRQIALPATSHLYQLDQRLQELGFFDITSGERQFERQQARRDVWWNVLVRADDQLRQRVAFALSQIFVVSDREAGIENRVRGFAAYHDMLIVNAFGNFRDLLTSVTLHPMMGDFLSMRRNEKANPSQNIQPDENYARELMQLFTIGLDPLNSNGTVDTSGGQRTTYTQETVVNFARVFTGWNYGDSPRMRTNARTLQSEIMPMKPFEEYHDTSPKQLLNGTTLPGGQTARQDLDAALDNLFEHPNVGPFIGRQLIQRLVTSNPSASYIDRVSNVFNNNGQGVRGDLAAVIKAILLDREALNGFRFDAYHFGKLKEPVVKISSIWRIFNARGEYGRLRYSDTFADFSQEAYSAPSVFNFYSPGYQPPGAIRDTNRVAPEFQILNESTVLRGADRLFDYAFAVQLGGADRSNKHKINLSIEPELALANNPEALVDRLNVTLMTGGMSPGMRDTLIRLATDTPLDDDGSKRVREVVHMIFVSPEFSVQR